MQAVYEKQTNASNKRIEKLTRKVDLARRKMNEIGEKLPERSSVFSTVKTPLVINKAQNNIETAESNQDAHVIGGAAAVQLVVPQTAIRSASDPAIVDEEPTSHEEGILEVAGSTRTSLLEGHHETNSVQSDGRLESRDSVNLHGSIETHISVRSCQLTDYLILNRELYLENQLKSRK